MPSHRISRSWRPALAAFLAMAGGTVSRAQLQAEPAGVDLGRHRQEEHAGAVVKLTNIGKQPLEITGTQSDCSCTAATPKKARLAPGESTSLEIAVETRNYQGVVRRRLAVMTTAGELVIPVEITVAQYAHWTVAPGVVVMPPSQRGREAVALVTLTYGGTEKVEIGKPVATPAYVDAAVSSADGKTFNVTLTKRPEAPAGNHSIKIMLETNDPLDPLLTLSVFAPVSSALRITPNPVVLPTVKVGQAASREVSLRGWGEGPAPRLELPQGSVRIREQSAGNVELEVSVTPGKPGPSTQLLRIYSGETLEAEVPVIVRAESVDQAK